MDTDIGVGGIGVGVVGDEGIVVEGVFGEGGIVVEEEGIEVVEEGVVVGEEGIEVVGEGVVVGEEGIEVVGVLVALPLPFAQTEVLPLSFVSW